MLTDELSDDDFAVFYHLVRGDLEEIMKAEILNAAHFALDPIFHTLAADLLR